MAPVGIVQTLSEDCVRVVRAQQTWSITVWVGFTSDCKVDLKAIHAAEFCDIILPFLGVEIHPLESFVVVDDKATSHRAKIVRDYNEADGIVTEDWPAWSPDLDMIGNAWDMLLCARSLRRLAPRGMDEFPDAVSEE